MDRLVWVEVAETEKLSYIHSMYLCVICTCVTASPSRDACIHTCTCTCTYGVAAAVWVFGGEVRCVWGREVTVWERVYSEGVWGRDYCAGVYPGFQRGGGSNFVH